MAFDLSDLMDSIREGEGALVVLFAVVVLVVCAFLIQACTILIRQWWQSRKRLLELGGVTTLAQTLDDNCTLCQNSMEAGEEVRTLSCDHAFHCGATARCQGIDRWLRTSATKPCPICRQVPQPVPSGTPPPRSSPATSALGLELPQVHGGETQTLPESSSSAPAPPRAAQAPRDSEEEELAPLLPRDETPPEAASSPPAPPLEQSPQDLEAALRLPADEDIVPDASSSQ